MSSTLWAPDSYNEITTVFNDLARRAAMQLGPPEYRALNVGSAIREDVLGEASGSGDMSGKKRKAADGAGDGGDEGSDGPIKRSKKAQSPSGLELLDSTPQTDVRPDRTRMYALSDQAGPSRLAGTATHALERIIRTGSSDSQHQESPRNQVTNRAEGATNMVEAPPSRHDHSLATPPGSMRGLPTGSLHANPRLELESNHHTTSAGSEPIVSGLARYNARTEEHGPGEESFVHVMAWEKAYLQHGTNSAEEDSAEGVFTSNEEEPDEEESKGGTTTDEGSLASSDDDPQGAHDDRQAEAIRLVSQLPECLVRQYLIAAASRHTDVMSTLVGPEVELAGQREVAGPSQRSNPVIDFSEHRDACRSALCAVGTHQSAAAATQSIKAIVDRILKSSRSAHAGVKLNGLDVILDLLSQILSCQTDLVGEAVRVAKFLTEVVDAAVTLFDRLPVRSRKIAVEKHGRRVRAITTSLLSWAGPVASQPLLDQYMDDY